MTRIAYVALDSAEYKERLAQGWKELHRVDITKHHVEVKMVLPDTNFKKMIEDGEGRN